MSGNSLTNLLRNKNKAVTLSGPKLSEVNRWSTPKGLKLNQRLFVRNDFLNCLTSMSKTYFVYLLSNSSKMIYIGVTNDLERRIYEHKKKMKEGFTKKYNLHQLVYYEEPDDIGRALEREKQLKGWRRQKKVSLIESTNPEWKDITQDWYK